MKILFLEDDPDQAESIETVLKKSFPDVGLITCSTEFELLEAIKNIGVGDLYFVVLDAMVPWYFPSEDIPIPPVEVQSQGIRYAGKRCLGQIRAKFGDKLPIWIYSVLSTEGHGVESGGRTYVLEKAPENGELLKAINGVINH